MARPDLTDTQLIRLGKTAHTHWRWTLLLFGIGLAVVLIIIVISYGEARVTGEQLDARFHDHLSEPHPQVEEIAADHRLIMETMRDEIARNRELHQQLLDRIGRVEQQIGIPERIELE